MEVPNPPLGSGRADSGGARRVRSAVEPAVLGATIGKAIVSRMPGPMSAISTSGRFSLPRRHRRWMAFRGAWPAGIPGRHRRIGAALATSDRVTGHPRRLTGRRTRNRRRRAGSRTSPHPPGLLPRTAGAGTGRYGQSLPHPARTRAPPVRPFDAKSPCRSPRSPALVESPAAGIDKDLCSARCCA